MILEEHIQTWLALIQCKVESINENGNLLSIIGFLQI